MSELSAILEKVLPGHRKVSQAPKLEELLRMSQSEIEAESKRKYKMINSFGTVFLGQNPALMEWQRAQGVKTVTRIRPSTVSTDKPKTRGQRSESFSEAKKEPRARQMNLGD